MQIYPATIVEGMPYSGKGTQCNIAASLIDNAFHISMGDILRAMDKTTALGGKIHRIMESGVLVNAPLTFQQYDLHMEQLVRDGLFDPEYHHALLDGVPRDSDQVPMINERADIVQLISLYAPEDVLVRQWHTRMVEEGRLDDADPEAFRTRLRVYEQDTAPMLDLYADNIKSKVDGVGSKEEVNERFMKVLATGLEVAVTE